MSLSFLGWFFVVSSIAMLLFLWRLKSMRRKQHNLETCKAFLDDIGTRLKLGEINDTEADAARLALLTRLQSARWSGGQILQNTTQKFLVAAAGFLVVSGIGGAISYVGSAPEAMPSRETIPFSGSDEEMFTSLSDYARTIGTEPPTSAMPVAEMLPDVNSMIEQLAARLENTPQDIEGWRMLGWSYFRMARYEQAATAFKKALDLDPGSAELKLSYEDAKAKASESNNMEIAPPLRTEAIDQSSDGSNIDKVTTAEAMPARDSEAAIRSMVDGLAHRLESSPRDVDGWIHLMRSRVVLGESVAAVAVLSKALEVFGDDSAASGKIKAAANELGLKTE
jgi:cytochrome c-type biogenesis protein CcmH/NrfG